MKNVCIFSSGLMYCYGVKGGGGKMVKNDPKMAAKTGVFSEKHKKIRVKKYIGSICLK